MQSNLNHKQRRAHNIDHKQRIPWRRVRHETGRCREARESDGYNNDEDHEVEKEFGDEDSVDEVVLVWDVAGEMEDGAVGGCEFVGVDVSDNVVVQNASRYHVSWSFIY